MTTPETPTSKVLFTFELAEHILSYLTVLDLTYSQLVCRNWRDVALQSPLLRQGLHLDPCPHNTSIVWRSEGKNIDEWQRRTRLTWKPYVETYTIARLHAFFRQDPLTTRRGLIAFTFNPTRALALRRPGRWEDMFVTQPVCRNIRIEFIISTHSTLHKNTDHVKDVNGVKLGSIMETVRGLLRAARMRQQRHDCSIDFAMYGPSEAEEDVGAWFERLNCYVDGFILETSPLVVGKGRGGDEEKIAVGLGEEPVLSFVRST